MGRQWLQAKREVANLRKGAVVGKLTKEIIPPHTLTPVRVLTVSGAAGAKAIS
jgi:hypothetical protein